MSEARRDLVAALRERGLVHQVTDEALGPLSARVGIVAYNGFDPSAPSLHAGNLYPIMVMIHLARAGHRPIALLGGGTGLIGDPSGKESERPLLEATEARANVAGMRRQIQRLFSNANVDAIVLDNSKWLSKIRFVDFLREIGKHFTVNWMIAKDSVRARLEDRDQGISFTEFAYMLLQAYDFYRLWKDHGCLLQTGASDQWGNITAGIELIRRKEGVVAYGLTCPLLLTPDGKKFGKSAGNAVWLDSARTSTYRFYQFWINQEDSLASSLLSPYTLLPLEEVASLRNQAASTPHLRITQKRLAFEVTSLVHGKDAAASAERASSILFGQGSVRELDAATLGEVFSEVPSTTVTSEEVSRGLSLGSLFSHVDIRLCRSNTDYRRQLHQNSLYLNNERVSPSVVQHHAGDYVLRYSDFIGGALLVLRRGKKDYAVVRLSSGPSASVTPR